MMRLMEKVLPPAAFKKVRNVLAFRAEDPNHLLQQPAQFETEIPFRYPAPGSHPAVRVPDAADSDVFFDNNFYHSDPRNLQTNDSLILNSNTEQPVLISSHEERMPSHGKRNITPLPYDPTGLRTTKTATWEATDAKLQLIKPDHLVKYSWEKDIDALNARRAAKGLPPAAGVQYKLKMSANYHEVCW